MPEPRLLIDLGNSRIKWLWSRGAELDLDSAGRGDLAALERAGQSRETPRPAAVLISSVAGAERTGQVVALCTHLWDVRPELLAAQAEQGGVRNGYDQPSRLGVDRWLAIVGAANRYGKPVVVWDLGSATTLDAVDETGQHLGGWILPGPAAMLAGLRTSTQLAVPESLQEAGQLEPGRSTAVCIRRGVLAAQAGALQQLLRSVSAGSGAVPQLVVTGGAAADLLPLLEVPHVHDPWLVFRGMAIV
jgi:type III pantothenate kinase